MSREDLKPKPQQEELTNRVTEIIALIPLETGAKLTEIGWERYGENEQEAIEKIVAFINQQVRDALDEVKSKAVKRSIISSVEVYEDNLVPLSVIDEVIQRYSDAR